MSRYIKQIFFLLACTLIYLAPNTVNAESYQESIGKISHEIASFIATRKQKNKLIIHIIKPRDGFAKTSCEPLSSFLVSGLRQGLIQFRNSFSLDFQLIDDNDLNEANVTMVGEWMKSGGQSIAIKWKMGEEKKGSFRDVLVTLGNFDITSLPPEAQKCFFDFDPIDREHIVTQPLKVRASPSPMADVIKTVSVNEKLWLVAKVRNEAWHLVLLPDAKGMSTGFKEKRGFVFGVIDKSQPPPPQKTTYELTVDVNPKDARIVFLNVKKEYQKGMLLGSGSYELEVSSPGFETKRKLVEIEKSDLEVSISLARKQPDFVKETSQPILPSSEDGISYHVSYVHRSNANESFKSIEVGEILKSGDEYKIILSSDQEAYFYIYQADSAGQIFQLFPMERFGALVLNNLNPVRKKTTYFIPAREKSFVLDEKKGIEKIYLIASRYRDTKIESLYEDLSHARYNRNQGQEQQTQEKMTTMFRTRGLGGIVVAKRNIVSWEEQGNIFSAISKTLEGMCDSCVNVIEFLHK